jgi:hypothetical protein
MSMQRKWSTTRSGSTSYNGGEVTNREEFWKGQVGWCIYVYVFHANFVQITAVSKALSMQECASKEKHVRGWE